MSVVFFPLNISAATPATSLAIVSAPAKYPAINRLSGAPKSSHVAVSMGLVLLMFTIICDSVSYFICTYVILVNRLMASMRFSLPSESCLVSM